MAALVTCNRRTIPFMSTGRKAQANIESPMMTQRNNKSPPLSGRWGLLPRRGDFRSQVKHPMSSTTPSMSSTPASSGENRNVLHKTIFHLGDTNVLLQTRVEQSTCKNVSKVKYKILRENILQLQIQLQSSKD